MSSVSRLNSPRRSNSGRRTKTSSNKLRPASSPASSLPTPDRIQQLAWGYAPPLILEAALNYRIFDLLDESPKTVEALARNTGASVRGLTAILNALVGLEFLARSRTRYTLTPESATFLVSTKSPYYGPYFLHMTRQLIPRRLHLAEAVRTGRPVAAMNQGADGPTFFAEFVEALFPVSYKAAQMVGEHVGIPGLTEPTTVLDIGAGSGVWGIALAHLSPQVTVWAVDFPVVLEVTRKVARQQGVADRLKISPGDLLEADFGTGHRVATIGHILHGEGIERSRRVLRRTFEALAPGGTVVIGEFMPKDDRTGPPSALIFAVNMLVNTEAGDTFTFREVAEWLKEAGFENPRLFEAPAPSPLVLATKPVMLRR